MTPIATSVLHRSGLGLKTEVRPALAADHRSPLLDEIRAAGGSLARGRVTVRLAQTLGFCYGVERAVQYAYEARRAFPERRIFLASPIIHNPQVNGRLEGMGIRILRTAGAAIERETGNQEPGTGDVVIIPAFGVPVEDMARLRECGAVLVDTTCGSVMAVWKSADRLAREGFTVIVHGNPDHEETRATVSRIEAAGGRWVVVRHVGEAERLAAWVGRGGSPEPPAAGPVGRDPSLPLRTSRSPAPPFPLSASPGLAAVRDLARVGLAHQTTMLASESRLIAKMLRDAVEQRWGSDLLPEHFRDFDTICSATQDRQDAVEALCREGIDLCLVVGGRDSHNTAHLAEVASRYGPTYHIEGAADILCPEDIRHWSGRSPRIVHGWLPVGTITIGMTAGASTPDSVTGGGVERVLDLA